MSQLTIAAAARAAGVDRTTLYRHVKAGKLSLTRDENGRRVVDASELHRVFPQAGESSPPVTPATEIAAASTVAVLQQKLEAAQRESELLQHQNTLLQQQVSAATDREQWLRQRLESLEQRLLPPPKKPFLDRLAEAWGRVRRL
jgi:hypothetical protein